MLLHCFVLIPYSNIPIRLVDCQSLKLLQEITVEHFINSAAISKKDKGHHLLVNIAKRNSSIDLIDLVTKTKVNKYYGHSQQLSVIECCFLGENEQFVACGSEDFFIFIWDRYSSNLAIKLEGHKGIVGSLLSWEKLLFTFGDDAEMRIWSSDELKVDLEKNESQFSEMDLITRGMLSQQRYMNNSDSEVD